MAPLRLRPGDLVVLRTVRSFVGPGRLRTSRKQTTIADAAGCCERSVRSAFRRLESWDYLSRFARPVKTGGRLPDVIEIRRPNRKRVAGSGRAHLPVRTITQIGTPSGSTIAAPVITTSRYTADAVPMQAAPQQPSFFPPQSPKPKKPRTPSQNDQDYQLWRRVFAEVVGRERVPVGPTAQAEERRHLKVLRQRFNGDDRKVDAFLREYAGLDDRWLDDRDYPLRYALSQTTYVRVVKAMEADVPAPVEPDRRPMTREDFAEHDRRLAAQAARAKAVEAEHERRRAEMLAAMKAIEARRRREGK